MQTLTDDLEIFALLEQAGKASFDHSRPIVFEFSFHDSWHLFLFNPSGKLKGCRLFTITQPQFNAEAGTLLLSALLALEEENDSAFLKNEALSLVEKLLQQRSAGQLFFDGH